jgi:hypothetical protein
MTIRSTRRCFLEREFHGEETYRVASVDDLMAMKRAAGRPKDIGHLELLEIAAEEIAQRGAGES